MSVFMLLSAIAIYILWKTCIPQRSSGPCYIEVTKNYDNRVIFVECRVYPGPSRFIGWAYDSIEYEELMIEARRVRDEFNAEMLSKKFR